MRDGAVPKRRAARGMRAQRVSRLPATAGPAVFGLAARFFQARAQKLRVAETRKNRGQPGCTQRRAKELV